MRYFILSTAILSALSDSLKLPDIQRVRVARCGQDYASAALVESLDDVYQTHFAEGYHRYDEHDSAVYSQSQINQQNEYYISLRAQANEEGNMMADCYSRSHDAYAGGDGALAKELSNEGKAHKARMEDLHIQASEWIFAENNRDRGPDEIDLHGLYVKEAIQYSERAVREARRRGDPELRLIVGRGLHSPGGVGKVKPAIEALLRDENLAAELDSDNAGVVIVRLDGSSRRAMDSHEIARRLSRDDESCTIM